MKSIRTTGFESKGQDVVGLVANEMPKDGALGEFQAVRPEPSEDLFIFGVSFWNPTYESFKIWWSGTLASPDRLSKGMVTANAHTLNNVWGSRSFRMAIDAIPVRLNDGIGFRIAARMRGVDPCYNFNGTDLIPRLLSELEDPLRVFLYGASEEANLKVATWLEEKYPLVRVVGRINGYVDPEKEAVPAIVKTDADLVLVALGHPKQEIFVARHASELNAKIVYCVGGLFDFLSGTKPRAPKIFRVASLEWVFRLAIEPRRMFRRYVVGNPVFLLRSLRQTVSDRRVKLNEARKVAV